MTLQHLKLEVDQLQYDDLVDLCNHTIALIKEKRSQESSLNITNFKVGDSVEFEDRGKIYIGKVKKVKKVNIDVDCGSATWTVPARIIKRYNP